jgi:hypothetical protein
MRHEGVDLYQERILLFQWLNLARLSDCALVLVSDLRDDFVLVLWICLTYVQSLYLNINIILSEVHGLVRNVQKCHVDIPWFTFFLSFFLYFTFSTSITYLLREVLD